MDNITNFYMTAKEQIQIKQMNKIQAMLYLRTRHHNNDILTPVQPDMG